MRRSPSKLAVPTLLAAAMVLAMQAFLPVLHAQHLASHHAQTSTSCCHHHEDHPGDEPDESADHESCATCLILSSIRQSSWAFDPIDAVLGASEGHEAPACPRSTPRAAPDLSTGPPRGPPVA